MGKVLSSPSRVMFSDPAVPAGASTTWLAFHAREGLDNLADADGARGRAAEGEVAVPLHVVAVLEALPLVVGEELAEAAEAQGDGLVWAELLHVVRVVDRPGVVAPDELLEPPGRVGEVDPLPAVDGLVGRVGEALAAVRAVVVGRGGAVEPVCLDHRFDRDVVAPVEAEEARHEVLRGLQHAVLGRGARDDLCRRVMQPAVVVPVQDPAVKELLAAARHEHLVAQLVVPVVEEGQLPLEADAVGNELGQPLAKLLRAIVQRRVPRSMTMDNVDLGDIGSGGQRILVHAEPGGGSIRAASCQTESSGVTCRRRLPTSAFP